MINLTKQQLDARWNILPIFLREILYSPEQGKIIWNIGEENHLSNEKIGKIAGLACYVIMGFLHSEDLAKEIKEATGIHSDVADLIIKEIDRKIFASIKSEIDKAYLLSLESEAPEEEIETQAPEIEESVVTDIRREIGGVKITKEVKYAQPAEVEPMKIIGVGEEEKLIVPKAEEKSFEMENPAIPEGPVVLHEEEELKTALGETKKKSLGELFGFLNGKEKPIIKESVSAGSVDIGEIKEIGKEIKNDYKDYKSDNGNKDDNGDKGDEIEKVVHYDTGLVTPLVESGINAEQTQMIIENKGDKDDESDKADKTEEIKKTESGPRLFFKNIIQAIKPTVKVVDFVETQTDAEQTRKDAEIPQESALVQPNSVIIDDKSDNDNKDNKVNKIDVEAPKMIVEETKEESLEVQKLESLKEDESLKEEIKEEKPEKKIGFFGKLFKSKKKEEDKIIAEAQIEPDLTQINIEQTQTIIENNSDNKGDKNDNNDNGGEKEKSSRKLFGLFKKKE